MSARRHTQLEETCTDDNIPHFVLSVLSDLMCRAVYVGITRVSLYLYRTHRSAPEPYMEYFTSPQSPESGSDAWKIKIFIITINKEKELLVNTVN